MELGLRIDVDTYRGTRLGVPGLCQDLAEHGIQGTFFFTVGPDNMGRHLWRLLRPAFLIKMLRTRAASLYGWDILLRGTVVPGPVIGRKLAPVIRAAADAGHEIGFHAWDHHAWQNRIARLEGPEIAAILRRGVDLLTEAAGRPPTCSAAPAWRCTDRALLEKLRFPFAFNSDCRGARLFQPVVDGQELPQPQVPTTLPTYDEALGRDGIKPGNYNRFILDQVRPNQLNVLTIHAEAEGVACRDLFRDFLREALARGVRIRPLGDLVRDHRGPLPPGRLSAETIPGREGWISCHRPVVPNSRQA